VALAILLIVAAGCGGASAGARAEPAAFSMRDFTTAAALPEADGWGIVEASERELPTSPDVSRAVLRIATTASPVEAGRLQAAMTRSLVEVAGAGAAADQTAAVSVISVEECDCHPAPPTYQVVGVDGPSVIWLTVSGPGVDRRQAISLFRQTRAA